MTDQFDIVVAGGGHNSLVTAAYLAKAGYSCLVLEARHVLGGNTMTEELTLPGFLHDTCSTAHAIFMESPIWRNQELPLASMGWNTYGSIPHLTWYSRMELTSPSGSILIAPAKSYPGSPEKTPPPIAR